jgi:hypothetical protein
MAQINQTQVGDNRKVTAFSQIQTHGNIYHCNIATGSSTGGYYFLAPTATLIQAQTLCTNDTLSGDVVLVGAGHAESITGAAGMTFSTAGVLYQGLGVGRQRPTITFSTATTAQMIISGANVRFDNFVFDFTGIDAIVAAIALKATDIQFTNCDFICNSGTAGVVRGLYANTSGSPADRLQVLNCNFYGPATNSGTTTTAQIDVEYGVDINISNNYFEGKMTQAILNATTCLRGRILNNFANVYTGTSFLTAASATTWSFGGLHVAIASGSTPVTAAAGYNLGSNTYANAAGASAATAF